MFRRKDSDDPDKGRREDRDMNGGDASTSGMNREMKRMMAKRERAADRLQRPPAGKRKQRTKPLTFIKEVRAELGRVAWPTRSEVVTYTVVVVVSVAFFMGIIFGMDFVFSKGVVWLIRQGGQ